MMNLRSRFLALALAAPCGWLVGCNAPGDDDGGAPAHEEALVEADEVDVAEANVSEAVEKGAPPVEGATSADQCNISGFPKPWGTKNWRSLGSVSLYSSADNLCWFSVVTSPSRTKLCAWVDDPVLGTRGKVCKSNKTSVTSDNVFAIGAPAAWGSRNGFPIWFDPLPFRLEGAEHGHRRFAGAARAGVRFAVRLRPARAPPPRGLSSDVS
jgi:hypothetical protein